MLRSLILSLFVFVLAPLSADALQIQAVEVGTGPADGPERFTQGSVARWQVATDVGVTSQDESSFETRYAAIAAIEYQGTTPSNLSNDWSVDFTITLDVLADPGVPWALLLEVERTGQADLVKSTSRTGSWVHVEALGGTVTGADLFAGSLVLPRPVDLVLHPIDAGAYFFAFQQTISAELRGVGDGSAQAVSVRFTGSPNRMASRDAEVAVRMGLPDSLDNFTAGAYPGLGDRTQADDGIFVRAQLVQVPEPAASLLLVLGLAGVSRARWRTA